MSLKMTRADQDTLLQSALEPTGSTGWKNDAFAVGVKAPDDELAAVAVFQNFGAGDADFHFAFLDRRPVTRGLIEGLLNLAFHHRGLGLNKVYAQIAASNRPAIRAAVALGFDFEHRKRGGFHGVEDAIILSMSRPDAGLVAARPQTEATT